MDKQIMEQLEKWFDEHFDELVSDIKGIVAIPSVSTYDEEGTPFGEGCRQALEHALALGRKYGFETRNYENRYGSMTLRPGDEEIAFWGHLDVVPAGDGWQLTEPFKPIERDGWLIARGAEDNKGPAMGVMYVLRAIEALKIPTRHGLRLFVGCDEEHGMRDVEHYAANYPPQKLTIIADCGFPVCYGEKGIIEANIVSLSPLETVTRLKAGMATNIVPAQAQASAKGEARECGTEWTTVTAADGATDFAARGISGHSAFPGGSVNAIHELTGAMLASGLLCERDREILSFFHRINDDFTGSALNITFADEVSGETTCVGTMLSMRPDGRAVLHVNIRYAITADSKQMLADMARVCAENGCEFELIRDSAPNYYPRENPVVDALTNVYNELAQVNTEPYVIGGGTYARKLHNAFGYGLGMPVTRPDFFQKGHGGAHQPDEGLYLPNLKRALLIFAMGILEADRVI